MKAFYAIFLLVFLASCGANTVTQVVNETTDVPGANIEENIPTEVEELQESEPTPEPSAVEPPSEEVPVISADVESTDIVAPSQEPPVIEGEGADNAPVEQTIEDINTELDAMDKVDTTEETPASESTDTDEPVSEEQSDEVSSVEMVELSTTYTNPAMEAVMNIALEVNSDNVIESISVTSPNYKGMPKFNDGVQSLVGKSLEEASEFYVSGSSLASPAFQNALKSAL